MYASIAIIRACADELSRRGISTAEFCKAVGLRPEELDNPTLLLPMGRYNAMLKAGYSLVPDDDDIGLHVGEHARENTHRLGQIAAVCGSLREANQLLQRYGALVLEDARFGLEEEGDIAWFTFEHPAVSPDNARHEAEGLLVFMLHIGQLLDRGMPARMVKFAHPRPAKIDEHLRIFQCPVEFDAPVHQILFDRASLDVPNLHRDEHLCEVLRRFADQWLVDRHAEARLPERVLDLLRYEVDLGKTGGSEIAHRLGMSPRVLQRKLRGRGIRLSDLIDQARRDTACTALADPETTVKDLSARLGFSEPSAFHRAFKRWTGRTPQGYRDSLRDTDRAAG